MTCECGAEISLRGRRNHERGGRHLADLAWKQRHLEGLAPLQHPYSDWVADGPGAVFDYYRFDAGGPGRRGRGLLCAWYVPQALAEMVTNTDIPIAQRREIVDAWKGQSERFNVALVAYTLSNDLDAFLSEIANTAVKGCV